MPDVFINYRVRDQAGYAALIYRELAARFGNSRVFYASYSINPGEDFSREIIDNLRRCTVLLAVIGPNWSSTAPSGAADPDGAVDDWVHREISEAFAAGVRVVPILVEEVALPRAAALPPDIAALARCQYLRLHHRTIESDVARLVRELARLVPELRDRAAEQSPTGARRPAEVLPLRIEAFRITDPASPCRIGIVTGTINRVNCADIWVNSENTGMEMSRASDFSISAIIRYMGARRDETGWITEDTIAMELAARVGNRRPVAPGTAFVTGAGALFESNNVRKIVHVAAVQGEPGEGFQQIRDVGRCLTNALTEADGVAQQDAAVRTVLFPLLGAGTGGAAVGPTAQTLLTAAVDYLLGTPGTALRMVYFLAYTAAELDALGNAVRAMRRLVPTTPAADHDPPPP